MIVEDETRARDERVLNIISVLLVITGLVFIYKKL